VVSYIFGATLTNTEQDDMKDAINNDFWATLTKAEIAFEEAQEQLHEMECEARGEAYAFGDAAVGAFVSISRQENQVQYHRNIFQAIASQLAA
tara:strand:- start:133 stop:411 length:279 start_codon:yes stop_codon:yes gene_type:complete